jgi:hypothetical protein
VEALLAFGAALLALRLSGLLAARWRASRLPHLAAWSAGLAAYALGAGALAWGAAAGWDDRAFRAYYLFGALLTAPLLGSGSLLSVGWRLATPVVLVYVGLAVGVMLAEPLTAPVSGTTMPAAQEHLDYVPARILALVGNGAGSLALVGVALLSLRRRPVGNALLLAGFSLAAAGSALSGLGAAETGAFIAVAALLLYGGTIARA